MFLLDGTCDFVGASHTTGFFFSELIGTMALIIFGNGAVACYELKATKGSLQKPKGGMNWLGVGFGYGFGVLIGVLCSGYSDHQINPASTLYNFIITIAGIKTIYTGHLWAILVAIIAQFIGAMLGQLMLDFIFWVSFKETDEPGEILSMHSTTRIKSDKTSKGTQYWVCFLTECFGTFMLILPLVISGTFPGDKYINNTYYFAICAGVIVIALVISVGGVTGPALNPARDLGPRIIYTIMPLPNKKMKIAEWDYSWIPVAAPLVGACLAAGVFLGMHSLSL